jgi:hypothetical protein
MKTLHLSLVLVSLLVLPARLSAFSAGSDTFAASPTITSQDGYADPPTNLTAFTAEGGEPNHMASGGAHKTAWWRWTAPSTGFCTVDTRRSLGDYHGVFDTGVAVYTGNVVNNLTRIAWNDDSAASRLSPDYYLSSCVFYAKEGVTYHIAVDGYINAVTSDRYNVILRLRHVPLRRSIRGSSWRITANSVNQAGLIQITTTGTGALTGRLRVGARSYPLAGVFGTDGLFTASFLLPQPHGMAPEPPTTLIVSGGGDCVFQVTVGSSGMAIGNLYERKVFTSNAPAPFAGRFTARLWADYNLGGNGFMTLKVGSNGRSTGVVVAPDGSTATFSAYAHDAMGGYYNFDAHLPRNNGRGVLNLGFFIKEGGAHDDLSGGGYLIRPPAPSAAFFPGGYNGYFSIDGGTWTQPAPGTRAFNFLASSMGSGKLIVKASGGEIAADFEEALTFGTNNKFVFVSGIRRPTLTLNLTTGVLTGSLTEPATRKRTIRGVLFRNSALPLTAGMGLLSGKALTQAFEVLPH